MTYQVLARKWRPRDFSSLVGQEHVVRALTHALNEGRLHHAYLFTGTRGVGKTTIARILAKSLNCEHGVSATPCGACSACQEIEGGRFVDLLEVDAATNTRVEEMRQLLENAVYAPTRGRFKVYVIDEVHMLSTSAFNAMLKTLEEPPEHVKFILATTDPQKIPVTVLSRCLQFNLKQMPRQAIVEHLERVLQQEALPFEAAALQHLANSAQGSMRDALSLLDQAIAHGAGRVSDASVQEMLGSVDLDHVVTLIENVVAGDIGAALAQVDTMALRSLSFDAALEQMASVFVKAQVAQLAPASLADDVDGRIAALAARVDAEWVQLAYQIAVQGRADLRFAPDPQAGFTMTLLRLHAFGPETPDRSPDQAQAGGRAVAAPPARRAAPAGNGAPPGVARPPAASEAPPIAPAGATDSARRAAAAAAPPATPAAAECPPPARSPAMPANAPRTNDATAGAAPAKTHADEATNATALADWAAFVPRLGLTGMARELAQHCEFETADGKRIGLRLSPTHRHLLVPVSQERMQLALANALGDGIRLDIALREPAGETPAAAGERARRERQDEAVKAIESDEFVREVINIFDATIIESSIKPANQELRRAK